MAKPIYVEQLTNNKNKKLINYLNDHAPGNVLLIFDHGLGDLIEFLPLLETLRRDYPKFNIVLGFHKTLDFGPVCDNYHALDNDDLNPFFTMPLGHSVVQLPNTFTRYNLLHLQKSYNFIFAIQFYDARHPNNKNKIGNFTKLDLCKVLEFGYNDNKVIDIDNYKIPTLHKMNNKDSKKVLFHCGGVTDKDIKNPTLHEQEMIWNEIKEAGFEPFDVHMNSSTTMASSKFEIPNWMEPNKTLRKVKGDLNTLLNEIYTSKYIVGCLSGPLHICNKMLGPVNCIGLEKHFRIKNYIPSDNINIIDIKPYIPGSVRDILLKLNNIN